MNEEVLVLDNIRHSYLACDWELAVDRLAVRTGEVKAVVGPNGAGKSTMLRIAAGAMKAGNGGVRLYGKEISSMPRREVAKTLGYLPQYVYSEYDYTVHEIACMGRYAHLKSFGGMEDADKVAVDKALELTEMSALADRRLSRVSGGEERRAFLASVLSQEPKVLLLDEPTSALDIHHQIAFFRLLSRLAADGMGVLIVTHEINMASLFADTLVLMAGGKFVIEGAPEEVLSEDNVKNIYGADVLVGRHPDTGRPTLIPKMTEAGAVE